MVTDQPEIGRRDPPSFTVGINIPLPGPQSVHQHPAHLRRPTGHLRAPSMPSSSVLNALQSRIRSSPSPTQRSALLFLPLLHLVFLQLSDRIFQQVLSFLLLYGLLLVAQLRLIFSFRLRPQLGTVVITE
ncbi:uncharacterized protein BJ212DRAFT_1413257 [Suillus subaureus]|uniref:Uncharacterized protein n=1 Tax=Suillus subaureus TaxID=48587 RepID=A0A9P7AQL3_9AGAM|nr:uncharacterized protein BJ212DRAFT_1413257 [Suillus subaureus]KAG1794265.1 hypothetical protein BJ212DRAFT_1413257 [Suillus subaureus]